MKRIILLICGFLLLALGSIGIVVPILPTTPFILASAICFSASSTKLYKMLLNNKVFGEYIRHYREKTGVRVVVKVRTLIFLYIMLIISTVLVNKLFVTLILCAVAIAVTIHILAIKTKPIQLDALPKSIWQLRKYVTCKY